MSDQETDNTEETQDATFNIGDFKSFISNTLKYLLYLLVILIIGFNVLYTCRHGFDEFINDYFPTDEYSEPFCHTNNNCKRSWLYPDTTITVQKYVDGNIKQKTEPYRPDFNIDCIKTTTNDKTILKGTYDDDYIHWILFWWPNTFMKTNIYMNRIYKNMYELIHKSIDVNKPGIMDNLIVFLSWIAIILLYKLIMPFIAFFMFFIGGGNAYDKYPLVLTFPVIGGLIFAILHLFKGNLFQVGLSLCGSLLGCIYQPVIILGAVVAFLLPYIKLCRIYVWDTLMMIFYIILSIGDKIFNSISGNTKSDIYLDPKYGKMVSYFKEFITGIFIIISIIVLSNAYTYLTKGIAIGMTICCFYLIYVYRHSSK